MSTAVVEKTAPTERQWDVFLMIYTWARDKGYQPSIREIMESLDHKSPNGVLCHVRALETKGWMKSHISRTRSMELLRNLDGSPFRGFVPK